MRILRRLSAADVRRLPWRNGRGVTDEIVVRPDDGDFLRGAFTWRVSKAAVTEDGPFSVVPGADRVLVVTRGEGLLLRHGDGATPRRVVPFDPCRFSGDAATTATLLRGPVADFNLFVRRDAAVGDVVLLDAAGSPTALAPEGRSRPGEALLHAHEGAAAVEVRDGSTGEVRTTPLEAGASLLLCEVCGDDFARLVPPSDPEARVLLVRVAPL